MNKDFRVSTGFFRHHKTIKLKRRLGLAGPYAVLALWAYAAELKPDGSLIGMDAEDIAIAAEWEDDPQALVETLCEVGFLEQCEEGIYHLHDWQEHNPWASEAKERSDKARLSKLKQFNKAAFLECEARGIDRLTPSEYAGWKDYRPATAGEPLSDSPATPDTPAGYPVGTPGVPQDTPGGHPRVSLAPSPSPSPAPATQEEEKRASCEASSPSADGDTSRPAPEQPETTCEVEDTEPTPEAPKKAACPYKRIVEAYNARLGQYLPSVRELTDKRKKHLRARWQSNPERQSVEWWDSYFEYVSRSPFLCGQKNGFRANFDWLVNPSNLTKVVEGTYHDQAEASAKGAPKGKQSVSEKNRSVFERLAAEG
ncbi:hypothetical protein ACI3L3_11860 [Desulfobaculum sp. SPO524]|uniref:hypothetical protein n=1 Tax=Desulfobaculum sp. SPO524 TaxID=3378071 RepID=UPI003854FE3F